MDAPDRLVDSFFQLTPERVLSAVEVGGRRATGYALALNSLENRVYEVELEDETRLVAKFYRPGRWSRAAIEEEHAFLAELKEAELPVVPPLALEPSGATLGELPVEGGVIYYAIFDKVRGRVPEELDEAQLRRLGRLVARLHVVGARRPAPARTRLDPESYGARSIAILREGGFVPPHLEDRFVRAGEALLTTIRPAFPSLERLRIHADCHLGNLLWGSSGPFLLDLDDFVEGPPVQDLWLIAPGRDEDAARMREAVADGYEELRALDRSTLRMVEPLRALRILRYAAWIAQRWRDPAFQRTFPTFAEVSYWMGEVQEVEDLARRVQLALA